MLSVSGSGVELGELMEQQRVAFPDEDTPHIITVLSTALLLAGMAWTHSRPHRAHMLPHLPCAFPSVPTGTHCIHVASGGLFFDVLFVPVRATACCAQSTAA